MLISKNTKFTIILLSIVSAATALMLTVIIIDWMDIHQDTYGSVKIIEGPGGDIIQPRIMLLEEDESMLFLNITYWNRSQALVNGTVLNFEVSDEIIQFITEKIREEAEERLEALETPYCDTPEGKAAEGCFDRYDYDEDTGLSPCHDGIQREDPLDCPDLSKSVEDELVDNYSGGLARAYLPNPTDEQGRTAKEEAAEEKASQNQNSTSDFNISIDRQ